MEVEIAVEFENADIQRNDIEDILQELRDGEEDIDFQIKEPKEAFPVPPADPFTVIIAAGTTIDLLIRIYPHLKERFTEEGGDVDLLDVEQVAIEHLVNNTNVTRDQLVLKSKSVSGRYLVFIYEYDADGSKHYIEINRDDPSDWQYEERE